jgi:hypothetical protein
MASGASDPARGDEDRQGDGGLGSRSVVLVCTLMFAVLIVPGLIYWRPPQLPFLVAFLVLPLVPAFVLGLVAVWSLGGSNPRRELEE